METVLLSISCNDINLYMNVWEMMFYYRMVSVKFVIITELIIY